MSIPTDDLLLKIKYDVYHRLLGDEGLATVPILIDDEHTAEDRDKLEAGPGNERAGKTGACITVLAVAVTGLGTGETPTPQMDVAIEIEAVEDVLINASADGTGINAAEIVARLVQTLHLAHFDDRFTGLRLAEKGPIAELLPEADRVGHRGYLVRFEASSAMFARVASCNSVAASVAAGLCTLTTGTSGATIYYTLDGSYPGSGNPSALTYSVPFAVTPGALVRAAAQKTGLNASKIVLFHAVPAA